MSDIEAFFIHKRRYKENRFIMDFFTKNFGMISVFYTLKSKKIKMSEFPNLQFVKYQINFIGNRETKKINSVDSCESFFPRSENIIYGLYANELLYKFLPKLDPFPELFLIYENFVSLLSGKVRNFNFIRYFERDVLKNIGYGIDLFKDSGSNPIYPEYVYRYVFHHGFQKIDCKVTSLDLCFKGEDLISFRDSRIDNSRTSIAIRRLTSSIIDTLIYPKRIVTRDLL